jgi:5-methyltetrahydrofolate--homocysteine methyltransferase
MSETLGELSKRLYAGDADAVASLVQQALDEGQSAADVLSGGLIAGMDEVGRDFKAGDLFVPEVLIAARAMHAGMAILRPLLADSDVPTAGKFLIGTVVGDLHDIGKNLVRMMLEGAGFETVDLGTDVKPEGFVAAVREHQPELLGMSALLTTTMPGMQATIDALQEAGLRDTLKIMVGGAPVTAAFAEKIGADAYAPDAASAVDTARALTG